MPLPPPPLPETLPALRAEIDRLDDALHELLLRRADVVAALAASRVKAAGSLLRPGREAMILRRLLARHHGPLPAAALVRLWREIFASSTALQGGFAVALFARGPEQAALAAEHFGVATPVRAHPTPARALAALDAGEAAVAVLPFPEEGEPAEAAWWRSLDSPRLQVVARLPFLAGAEPAAEALVVAAGAPDPSAADFALVRLEIDGELGRSALLARLAGAGFVARQVLLRRDGPRLTALVEVEGRVEAADARLAALDLDRALPLGFYAAPIRGGE